MFSPPALLAHRHLQSLMSQAPWRRRRILMNAAPMLGASESVVIECGDGARLQGFFSLPRQRSRGLVVLLHGWEGSADSSYILSAGAVLHAAGFSLFRLNFRDHGSTETLNEELFHSCRIAEVLDAVIQVRERYPAQHFALVGQSLGGNFALRVAASATASGLDIGRVLAICPVLKPHSTMAALDDGWWVYRRYFLARWRRSLQAKATAFPQRYAFGDLRRFSTLTAMTRFFVENYTEFATLDDYLNGYAITGAALSPITVSTRMIIAADDPIIPAADLDQIARPAALDVTLLGRGGHCGFVDSLTGPSWIDREVLRDLDRALQ